MFPPSPSPCKRKKSSCKRVAEKDRPSRKRKQAESEKRTKAARVLINNDSGTGSNSGCGRSLLQFAIEEFQLLLSDKWIRFLEDISYGIAGRLQAEAAWVLKNNGFNQSPVLKEFLGGDMTKAAHDSGSHSNSGVLPAGSSLRQFAIKEFQKLLSDKWIPCLEDISCGLVRGLVINRKCCLQLQIDAARVLTDKDFKCSPLLQKLLDGDMLDLPSIVARVLPSKPQQLVTKEYEDMLSDKLSRIVEDLYSDFLELLARKYFLKPQPGAARENSYSTTKKSTPKFRHLPDPSQKIRTKLQEVDLLDLQSMVSLLESADSDMQLLGIKQLGQLFSEGFVSEIKGILKSFVVVVPLLANMTRTVDSLELQSEAAGTLIHVISHYSSKPLLVIKHKLVQVLLNLLDTDSVCEKAVEELQKVAFHPQSRNYALQHGALDTLLRKLDTTNVSMLRKLTLTISKFCGGIIEPPFNQVRPAIIVLRDLVDANDDEEVLSNACEAFCYLSGTLDMSSGTTIWGEEEFEFNTVSLSEVADTFHAVNVLPVLVKLLNKYSSPSIIAPAIDTVVNISTTDDGERICIPEDEKERFLHCLLSLLFRGLEEEMVCVIIAYITGESTPWAEAVFAAGLIEPLRELVEKKKMGIAAVAIANAIDGTVDDEQMESLVKCCIDLLCNYVDSDNKLWADAGLKGIEKILKLGEAKKANNGGYNVYAQKIKEDVKLENFTTPKLEFRAKAILSLMNIARQ